MADKTVDILIVGGGLIGTSLMLALADKGYSTLLVDAQPPSNELQDKFDTRSLALSPASVQILKMLQIWPYLETYACPIDHIHVSEQHRFGATRLHGKAQIPLGYVIEMPWITQALTNGLQKEQTWIPAKVTAINQNTKNVTVTYEGKQHTIHAKLIVAADGTFSNMRQLCGLPAEEKSYQQHALVANIGLARPHMGWAYERFTPSGPLAMLPMRHQRASLVWSLPYKEATTLQSVDSKLFLHTLQRAFGYRLGRLMKVGTRAIYPLRQVIMPKQAIWPFVFIGNAAHTLHPVAGQGFNLGLRDVAMLAQEIIEHGLETRMLNIYLQNRHHDQTAITAMTNGLINVFTSHNRILSHARSTGLLLMDNAPRLKNILSRYASGYAGVIPDLVCGLPLKVNSTQTIIT